jgi:hypothetical protein
MLRFLVKTSDSGIARWQVHGANCPDVSALLRGGASVEVASAKAPQAIVADELGTAEQDFAIMLCAVER